MVNRTRFLPDEYRQRPKDLNPGMAEHIIERIANGETLTSVCLEDIDLPMPATFLRWCRMDPVLSAQYVQAMKDRTDLLVEEILDVSSGTDPVRAGVESRSRMWMAERLDPAKYGSRNYQLQTKPEDDVGGVDHAAELRRRIERLAANVKIAEERQEAAK